MDDTVPPASTFPTDGEEKRRKEAPNDGRSTTLAKVSDLVVKDASRQERKLRRMSMPPPLVCREDENPPTGGDRPLIFGDVNADAEGWSRRAYAPAIKPTMSCRLHKL